MKRPLFSIFFLILLASCKTAFQPVNAVYEDYRITSQLPQDSALSMLLKPYKDSLDKTMNEIVGNVGKPLEKKQPENSLGYFMSDALFFIWRKKNLVQMRA